VGKFVSFSPSGVSEDDIRFQDMWLRTFQEADTDGKFRLKMIRKADQNAKSWPRAGKAIQSKKRLVLLHKLSADHAHHVQFSMQCRLGGHFQAGELMVHDPCD